MMRGGSGGHGGWGSIINAPDERLKVTWELLRRVLRYAAPYRLYIAGMLSIILVSTGLSLLTPLIMRDLIDKTIPSGNITRLIWLALALLALPIVSGTIDFINRRLNVTVGEGLTCVMSRSTRSAIRSVWSPRRPICSTIPSRPT